MAKTFKIVDGDISDGYHTFDELYEHRCLLFVILCLSVPNLCAWRPDFENWFVMYMETPAGQVSYHIPNKMLPYIESRVRRDDNYKWDEHTGADVVERWKTIAESQGGVGES